MPCAIREALILRCKISSRLDVSFRRDTKLEK